MLQRKIAPIETANRRVASSAWPYSFIVAMALLAPVEFLPSLALDMYLPIIPRIDAQFDGTGRLIQLSLAVCWIVMGTGQLLFGPLCDWIGRRPVLAIGTMMFAVASLFMAYAESGEFFIAFRAAQALGSAAILASLYATVRDVYGEDENATAVYAFLRRIVVSRSCAGPAARSNSRSFLRLAEYICCSCRGWFCCVRDFPAVLA